MLTTNENRGLNASCLATNIGGRCFGNVIMAYPDS